MKNKLFFAFIFLILIFSFVSARDFIIYNSSNEAQPYFWVNGTTGVTYGTFYGSWNGSTNYVPYTGSNANVVLGDYNFSVGTNDLFVDASSGYVGINTTTPGFPLEVNGISRFDQRIQVTGNSAPSTEAGLEIGYSTLPEAVILSYNRSSSTYTPIRYNAYNHTWQSIGSTKMFLDGSGNLGIGTTTPQNTLNVVGTANITSNFYALQTAASPQSQGAITLNDVGGIANDVMIGATSGGDMWFNVLDAGSYKWYGNTGSTKIMELDNVGATGILNVTGNVYAVQFCDETGSNCHDMVDFGSYLPLAGGTMSGDIVTGGNDVALGDGKLYLRTNGDANHYLWNNADDWEELVAYTGTGFKVTSSTGENLLTVQGTAAGGFVGVGTTSPGAELELNDATGNSALYLSGGASGNEEYSLSQGITAVSNGGFSIRDRTNSADRIVIAASTGYVGIGTSSPSYILTINKASNPQIALTEGDVLKTAFTHVTADDSFRIYNGGGDRFVIGSSGHIGIGTTTPGAKLEINVGSAAYGGGLVVNGTGSVTAITVESAADKYPVLEFKEAGAQKWQIYNSYTTDNLEFYHFTGTAGISMALDNAGNVGIGDSTPDYKLDVEGAGYFASGVYVPSEQIVGGVDDAPIKIYNIRGQENGIEQLNVYNRISVGWSGGWGSFPNAPSQGIYAVGDIKSAANMNALNYCDESGNNCRDASSGVVTGTGTDNYIPRWNAAGTGIENSIITDDGSTVTVLNNAIVQASAVSWSEGLSIDSANGIWGGIKWRTTGRSGNTGNWHLGYNSAHSGTTDSNLYLYNGAGLYPMTWDYDTGNVGIGTTSPYLSLDVQRGTDDVLSGTGYRIAHFSSTAAVNADMPGLQFGYDTTGGGIIAPATQAGTTNFLSFWTYNSGWAERMRLTKEGNVGIGTTTPGTNTPKLTISGSGVNSAISLINTGTSGREWQIYSTDSIYSQGAGKLLFYRPWADGTGGTMVLDSSGNVGIGDTTPDYTLDVAGTIGSDGDITAGGGEVNLGSTTNTFSSSNWAGTTGYPAYVYTGGNSRFGFSSTSGYVDVYADGNFYAGIDLNGNNNLVWHAGNDGSGTGLDADTLDTYHETAFIRARGGIGNANAAVGSTTGWPHNPEGGSYSTSYVGHSGVVLMSNDVGGSASSMGIEATFWGNMYLHTDIDSSSWATYQMWTDANDGSGSGLDADLFDSIDSTGFYRATKVTAAQIDTVTLPPGYYNVEGEAFSGLPNSYNYFLQMGPYSGGGYATQIASPYQSGTNLGLYYRTSVGSNWGSWTNIWTGTNDGTGSGLDADLLDGLSSGSFAREYQSDISGFSNAGWTNVAYVDGSGLNSIVRLSMGGTTDSVVVDMTADILVNHYQDIYVRSEAGSYTVVTLLITSDENENFYIQAKTDSANAATLDCRVFTYGGETVTMAPGSVSGAITLQHVAYSHQLSISSTGGSTTGMKISNNTVWHAGNDGSGSTLDADLLDGHDTSYFQTALTNPVTGTGTSPRIAKFTGTSTIGNSNIYDDGTYVGIGVDASLDTLEVAGGLRVHTGNNWDAVKIYSGGQDGYITGLGDEVGLHIRSEAGNIFLADDRGNVGIGTTSPGAKLEISAGSGYDTGQTLVRYTHAETTNYFGYTKLATPAGDPILIMGTYDKGSSWDTLSMVNGNVGIGDTTPDYTLDVAGTLGVDSTAYIAGATSLGSTLSTASTVSTQGGTNLISLPWFNCGGSCGTGYVKLVTPIGQSESNMFTITIKYYQYGDGGHTGEIMCGGYAYSGSSLITTDCHTEGTNLPVEIGQENGVVVIRLGSPTYGSWYYTHFTAEYIGWQAKNPADFTWVASQTTPSQTGNTNNVYDDDSAGTVTATTFIGALTGTASLATVAYNSNACSNDGTCDVTNLVATGGANPIVSAGSTSTDGMLFDGGGNYRPAVIVRGSYPHLELWSDVANDNHGATLRLSGYDNGASGAYKSWVIGTPGSNVDQMDIGYSTSKVNPHEGIAGYTAGGGATATVMRLTNNGNVGIGNFGAFGSLGDETPDYTLDVRGSLSATGIFRSGGNFIANGDNFYMIYPGSYYHTPRAVIRQDSDATDISYTPGGLVLYNANGGINTMSSLVFASREQAGAGNDIALSGINGWKISAGNSGGWSQGGLKFWVKDYATVNEAMSIIQNGNVGVGDSNPTEAKLSVYSAGAYSLNLDSTQRYKLGFSDSGTSEWWIATDGGNLAFHENGVGDKVTLQAGGSVGIGDSTPDYNLDVAGTLGVDGIAVIASELQLYNSNYGIYTTTNTMNVEGYSAIAFNINDGSVGEVMRVNGAKVGVGTNAPSHKFTANVASMNVYDDGQYPLFATVNGKGVLLGYNTTSDVGILQSVHTGTAWKGIAISPNGGYTGIAMYNPSVALDVTGDIEYTGTITDVSDIRLKENIMNVSGEQALAIISQLQAKSFYMIEQPRNDTFNRTIKERTREYGFIAQEVQPIFPDAITITDPENGYLGISYMDFIPLATESIKELNKKIEVLENNKTIGITNNSSFWMCTSSDCSAKCQVQMENGVITGCI